MQILDATKNCEPITPETQIAAFFRASIDVWYRLKGDRELPVWQVDHLMEFPAELIPYANVTVSEPHNNGHRFLFWGSGRTEMMKCDYTNMMLSQLQPPLYAELVKSELDDVLSLRQPLKSSVQVLLENGVRTQVDKIRLPFAGKTGDASVVVSLDDVHQFRKRFYLSGLRGARG